jgi:16S rRNA (adenine1518-N6/adenine1519-N6)-dimethyltransferase
VIRTRKRFGQHFLHDAGVLRRILDAVDPRPGDRVVEIGPGPGVLTELLIERIGPVDAIEIDRDLAAALRQRWPQELRLHEGDALEFDFGALAGERGGPLRVVGNLPYNISTPLLFHLLAHRAHITDLTVMLQKEVIDRIVARPGNEHYGRLGVMLFPWFEMKKLFDVGPGAFRPPPKVWSSVARLNVLPGPRFAVPPAYAQVVAQAFSQRRKTLRNALRGLLGPAAFDAAGIDPGARPETLSPQQFAALAELAGNPPA